MPHAVLAGCRQHLVDPGAVDDPRDVDQAHVARAAHDRRDHGLAVVVGAAEEHQIGIAVAVDVAHAAGRAADVGRDEHVSLFGDAGDAVELHRAEQEIAAEIAMNQQVRFAVAVEVGQPDARG